MHLILSEAMWKDELRHNATIASDHLKHHDVDWVFGFHHYLSWGQSKPMVVNEFIIGYWQKFVSSGKNQSMFRWKGFLSLFKGLAAWSFLLSFKACDKNCPFLILYKKYWMSSWTTCLIRNVETCMLLAVNLIDLLKSLLVMARISTTNSEVLFLSER